MSNYISDDLHNILQDMTEFVSKINKATQKLEFDFLPKSLEFANYFTEYFTNGLLVNIQQDKITDLTIFKDPKLVKFFSLHPASGINVGRLLLQKSYPQEALWVLDAILVTNPDNLEANIQKGLALLEIRDYAKADKFYEVILKKFPNNFILHETYARNAHRKADWNEALSRWIEVVKLFPKAVNPINQLNLVVGKVKDSDKVIEAYKLLGKTKDKKLSRFITAKVAEQEGNLLQAARCYQGIMINDPNDQNAIKNLLNCYVEMKDYEALKNHILRTNLTDTSIDFKLSLATILSDKFLFDYSELLLNNLVALTRGREDKVIYRLALSDIYRSYGHDNANHYERGAKLLEELVKKNPDNTQYKVDLANIYIGLNKKEKAFSIIEKIDPQFSHNYVPRFIAWQKYMSGNIEECKQLWTTIAHKQYGIAFKDVSKELKYLSNKEIQISPSDIVLFTPARNEMLRLPYFLEYYRNLGVNKFFIIDNDSTDNSIEFLLAQSDVYLFQSNNSFSASGHGVSWVNYLIQTYANNNWVLNVDCDELLVYPDCENRKLQDLCHYLEKHQEYMLPSFMLDFFPATLEEQLHIKSGDNLIKSTGYFYNDYAMLHTVNPPFLAPRGGIFSKLLGPKYLPLVKIPLLKSSLKTRFLSVAHIATPEKVSRITSALLHFKLIGDFKARAQEEIKRKQHAGSGSNYRGYYDMMNNLPDNFVYTSLDKTVKYQNTQQLVDLGLIHQPSDY